MTAVSELSPANRPPAKVNRWAEAGIALALVGMVLAVYGQTTNFEFVNFDDNVHVYENPAVTRGLTWDAVVWAFGIHGPSQWHPLAWLSHQVDCALFGLDAGGHHLMNVLLHAAAAVLLYVALRRLTGEFWASAWIAAAFAVHPLNVESVAWVSERRNVLTAVFWFAGLNAYIGWVRRGGLLNYGLLVMMHALALMSKPMAVTFPCVLLLLDYWPLRREFGVGRTLFSRMRSCVWEKLPLFAMSGVAAWLSIECQRSIGTVASLTTIPLSVRFVNAVAAYGWYLGHAVWPRGLSVFYPHPAISESDPWARLALPATASAVVLVLISFVAWWRRATSPWLLTGWLWFLGTLVPMIGLVQVGEQQQADRYAYIPLVGIFLAVVLEAGRLLRERPFARRAGWLAGATVLAVWTTVAWIQVGHWRDSFTLFRQAIANTERNHWAYNNLALSLQARGRREEAVTVLRQAVQAQPSYALAHYNLGLALYDVGQKTAARSHLELAVRLNPRDPNARLWLGAVLAEMGERERSIAQFQAGADLSPGEWQPLFNLGVALASAGRYEAAADALGRAERAKPGDRQTLIVLAGVLQALNRHAELARILEPVVEADPSFVEARYLFGKALIATGDVSTGERYVAEALSARPDLQAPQRGP